MDRTILHQISEMDNADELIDLLFSHPKLDVNKVTCYGSTPLYYAAEQGNLCLCRALLKRPETDVNRVRSGGESPFWRACSKGYLNIIQLMIVIRPEIDVHLSPKGSSGSPLVIARISKHTEVVDFLESYIRDPVSVHFELWLKLGYQQSYQVYTFSMMVLYSDDFLSPSKSSPEPLSETRAKRFFRLTERRPLELQAKVCACLFGSKRSGTGYFPSTEVDTACRKLFRQFS